DQWSYRPAPPRRLFPNERLRRRIGRRSRGENKGAKSQSRAGAKTAEQEHRSFPAQIGEAESAHDFYPAARDFDRRRASTVARSKRSRKTGEGFGSKKHDQQAGRFRPERQHLL